MYTATMRYEFSDEWFERGVSIWRETVLERAKEAPGLVRMQLLARKPVALAIGTWKEKSLAEDFMKTGVFKELTERLSPALASQPRPETWELDSFFEA